MAPAHYPGSLVLKTGSFGLQSYSRVDTWTVLGCVRIQLIPTVHVVVWRTQDQHTYIHRTRRWGSFAEFCFMTSQCAMLVAVAMIGFGTYVDRAHVNVMGGIFGIGALILFFSTQRAIRLAFRARLTLLCI